MPRPSILQSRTDLLSNVSHSRPMALLSGRAILMCSGNHTFCMPRSKSKVCRRASLVSAPYLQSLRIQHNSHVAKH